MYKFNNLENDPKFHLTYCLIDIIHPIISSYLYQLEIPVRLGAKHIFFKKNLIRAHVKFQCSRVIY